MWYLIKVRHMLWSPPSCPTEHLKTNNHQKAIKHAFTRESFGMTNRYNPLLVLWECLYQHESCRCIYRFGFEPWHGIGTGARLICILDWTGLDWTELDWTELDWTGLEWSGMEWNGIERDGKGLDGWNIGWNETLDRMEHVKDRMDH